MVGMFFSDGVLVAGVAVGRRGPLAFFFIKCTLNLYIYIYVCVSSCLICFIHVFIIISCFC